MAIDYFLMGELSKTSKRIVGDKSPLLTPETKGDSQDLPRREDHPHHQGWSGRTVSAVHHFMELRQNQKGWRGFGETHNPPQERSTRDAQHGREHIAEGQLRKFAAEWSARVSP